MPKVFSSVLLSLLVLLARQAYAQPLSLADAVQTALAHNPEVAAADQDIAVLRTRIDQVRSYAHPKADILLNVTAFEQQPMMEVPAFVLPLPAQLGGPKLIKTPDLPLADSTLAFGAVNVQYPISTGGRVAAHLAQVQEGIKAVNARAKATRYEVTFNVVKAYLSAAFAARVATVNDETYATVKQHEAQAAALFKQGMVPKYEWMRAQTEVANQERRCLDAHNQAELAIAYLQDLLGTTPGEPFTLTTPLRGEEPFDMDLTVVKAKALDASEYLKALQARDRMYLVGEHSADAELHPTLAAVAAQRLFINKQPFTSPGGFLGIIARIPLLDGGLAKAERQEQAALRVRNQDDIRQVTNGINLEVRKCYLDLLSARKALEAADKTVELAQESLRLATRRFAEAQGTGVEQTDAVLALSLAQINREQARYQYDLAYYALKKMLGQILDEFQPGRVSA